MPRSAEVHLRNSPRNGPFASRAIVDLKVAKIVLNGLEVFLAYVESVRSLAETKLNVNVDASGG